ncbi:MAG: Eco47II family restriction endonuclease, partial [Oscillospiraceae bacterium]|nr:Eco47II family restriction endonuclease [Oscillospiraceae bacterium]
IDRFYAEVTGIENAFYMLCMQLPETINELINERATDIIQEDTVIYELKQRNPDLLKALYLLAFETYEGFSELI